MTQATEKHYTLLYTHTRLSAASAGALSVGRRRQSPPRARQSVARAASAPARPAAAAPVERVGRSAAGRSSGSPFLLWTVRPRWRERHVLYVPQLRHAISRYLF